MTIAVPRAAKWLPLPETDPDFQLLVVDRGTDLLYFLKPLDGRAALYRIKLDGSETETLVASNPNVDIDTVIEVGPGQPVVGYRYTDDRTRSVYTDPAMQSLGKALAAGAARHAAHQFRCKFERPDEDPAACGQRRRPGRLLPARPEDEQDGSRAEFQSSRLTARVLRRSSWYRCQCRTAESIPAYLTMRSDLGPGPHPAVVMPHGGTGGPRHMELRLARPVPRCPGLCRHSAELSRLQRVRRAIPGRERFSRLAQGDVRHSQFCRLAGQAAAR